MGWVMSEKWKKKWKYKGSNGGAELVTRKISHRAKVIVEISCEKENSRAREGGRLGVEGTASRWGINAYYLDDSADNRINCCGNERARPFPSSVSTELSWLREKILKEYQDRRIERLEMRLLFAFARFLSLILLCTLVLCERSVGDGETKFVDDAKSKLRILAVFGHPGKSHFDFFKPLLVELARRGHELTVVSHFPRKDVEKSKEALPNYKDISLVDPKVGVFVDVVDLRHLDHSALRIVSELFKLREMASFGCQTGLRNEQVGKLVRSGEKFDLVLTENFNTNCFLPIVQKFKAPFIYFSSHALMPWAMTNMGNPQEADYMPTIFQGFTRPMDFLRRTANVLAIFLTSRAFELWFGHVDQALAREVFGPDVPDLEEIAKNGSLVMVNTHHSLHGSRPLLPNIVEIGGLHIPPRAEPLPMDVRKFIDEARQGVLYFNLGSMIKASSMPEEKLVQILRVLGSLPMRVIWKWEAENLPHKPDNVLIRKWLPQFDILSHPNVKCYLGHGGLLGLSEGVYNGVPMVLVPMFGDQFHNAAAAKTRGVAVVLDFNRLNEQTLREALDRAINDTRYRENARKLSKAYRDRPASPLETAVWWTEYIGRGNGLPYLRSEALDLPWYRRHLLDVALFLLTILLALIYLLYLTVKFLSPFFLTAKRAQINGEIRRSKKKD
ncbi:hypothetical protein KM043_002966 [Ampulex compressa]|nr:hypothetical protein KM043_002966 [Ampulex compressa]